MRRQMEPPEPLVAGLPNLVANFKEIIPKPQLGCFLNVPARMDSTG